MNSCQTVFQNSKSYIYQITTVVCVLESLLMLGYIIPRLMIITKLSATYLHYGLRIYCELVTVVDYTKQQRKYILRGHAQYFYFSEQVSTELCFF